MVLFWPHLDCVYSSGPHNLKIFLRYLHMSWVGQQSWWKGWKAWCPVRTLGLCGLEKKGLKGDFIALCSLLRRRSRERERDAGLFFLISRKRTRGNGSKFHPGRFRLEIRKYLLIYLLRGWSNTRTGFLERWLMPPVAGNWCLSALEGSLDNDFNLL